MHWKNGISETSPFRVESAVLYILKQMNKEGDVFSYIQDIEAEGKEFLKLDKSYIDKAVESLVGQKNVLSARMMRYILPICLRQKNMRQNVL